MSSHSKEFLAGYALAVEESAKIATGWETNAAGDDYMTDDHRLKKFLERADRWLILFTSKT